MPLQDIAVVIITRDAADTLARTLESVKEFSSVVVYDNGSQDGTQNLAKSFSNVKLIEGPFKGFGPTKNYAATFAEQDWILSLDSDEAVSPGLLDSLRKADLSDTRVAYQVCRRNFFMGRPVERGGWGRDWLVRLYNRTHARFKEAMVHENIELPASTRLIKLQGFLDHLAVREIRQILQKINRYTELRRESSNRTYPTFIIMVRTTWAFLRSYVLELGFLAGWRGLVIAVSNANGVFYKYMKIYADRAIRKEERDS